DRDVAGREVGQDRRSRQRRIAAGRYRDPEILTDLDVKHESLEVTAREQKVRAEGDLIVQQTYRARHRVTGSAELTLLVELPVVREVALGHDSKDSAAMHHHRCVEQPILDAQGSPQ